MTALHCYLDENDLHFTKTAKKNENKTWDILLKAELMILPFVLSFAFLSVFHFYSSKSQVLGEASQITPSQLSSSDQIITVFPTSSATIVPPSPTPTVELTPTSIPTKKESYSIAIFGDSMVDTMGERLEYLEHALKKKYPDVNFTLYNYGIGAQNVEMGIERLTKELNHVDRHYPPLSQINPDIIIVGSFAYNPFTPHDRNQHWLSLTKLIESVKTISPKVYMLAEITPLRHDFGRGPNGVNWETSTSYEHSGRIIEQLENAVGLSETLKVPLINVFKKSEGKREYVNPSDGIHPSVEGHEFTAELITETIQLD